MSPRTIERYISKCLNTGDVNSEKLGRPFNSFAMHAHVEFVIMEAILEQPDTTLAEIAYNVFALTGLENAVSSILRYLKRNTFTCKKVCTNFFYKAIKNCPSKIRGSQGTFQIQCLSPRS